MQFLLCDGRAFYLLIEMYIVIVSWHTFLWVDYTIKQARFHILLRLQIFFDLYTECSLRLIPYAFLCVDRLEEMLLLMSENTDPLYNALFLHKVGGAENLQWVKQVYALRNACLMRHAEGSSRRRWFLAQLVVNRSVLTENACLSRTIPSSSADNTSRSRSRATFFRWSWYKLHVTVGYTVDKRRSQRNKIMGCCRFIAQEQSSVIPAVSQCGIMIKVWSFENQWLIEFDAQSTLRSTVFSGSTSEGVCRKLSMKYEDQQGIESLNESFFHYFPE